MENKVEVDKDGWTNEATIGKASVTSLILYRVVLPPCESISNVRKAGRGALAFSTTPWPGLSQGFQSSPRREAHPHPLVSVPFTAAIDGKVGRNCLGFAEDAPVPSRLIL